MRRELPFRVLIVDDHPVVRRGLRDIFSDERDFEVCGEASDMAGALLEASRLGPDLVVADLSLGGRDGLELTRQLRSTGHDAAVLVVTVNDEQLYAGRAYRAGARGYVMKSAPDATLLRAARQVASGGTWFSDDVRAQVEAAEADAGTTSGEKPLAALTDRELQVLRLVGQGYAPREIADALSLSVSTVENYRERMKKKLGLDSSRVLQRYAVRWVGDFRAP